MRIILASLSFSLLLIYACNSNNCSADKKPPTESIMYEPSELAILMKQMHAQELMWKQMIEADSFAIDFPTDFMGIYTEEPTDSNLRERDEHFISFADKYIDNVKALIDTKKQKKQIKRFNATIDACIDCHTDYCQGPIDKIKKLYIN